MCELEIELTRNIPIHVRPYRRSLVEDNMIEEEIQEMLKGGIISLSKSSYYFPVLMIPKKNGEKRFCVDFRKLNVITIQRGWPMNRIDNLLDRLRGAIYYTLIDGKKGYWQFGVELKLRKFTGFSSRSGHYEFNKVAFGLRNAPAIFCEAMFQIFGHLKFVECNVDDIIIFSETVDEHFKHIKIVLKTLQEHKLKINLEKCQWFCESIKLLGHVVSKTGVEMDPAKVESILNRKEPTNVK